MEGAAAARAADGPTAAMGSALLVGFDFATSQHFARLLGEPHPARETDPVADLLAQIGDQGRTPIARMVAAAWREALFAVATGVLPEQARAAVAALTVDEAILSPAI